MAHLALLVPPEALCSPATSPKFSKRCPYGARLAPATGGAPATFSAAAARPPQQSSRRAPGGGFNPRPAPLFLLPAGGRVASQSHIRFVFYGASASISVKKAIKGTRSTKRHATKGRGGTDKISLWRELIVMIKAKGLAVSAALDLLAASEILSCFSLNHRKKWISIEFGLASR